MTYQLSTDAKLNIYLDISGKDLDTAILDADLTPCPFSIMFYGSRFSAYPGG
jgi:hypothetical protein